MGNHRSPFATRWVGGFTILPRMKYGLVEFFAIFIAEAPSNYQSKLNRSIGRVLSIHSRLLDTSQVPVLKECFRYCSYVYACLCKLSVLGCNCTNKKIGHSVANASYKCIISREKLVSTILNDTQMGPTNWLHTSSNTVS